MEKWLFIIAALFSIPTFADDWTGTLKIRSIRIMSDSTYVGIQGSVPNTCNNWGEILKFDNKTEHGKALLTALLTAKSSGTPFDI